MTRLIAPDWVFLNGKLQAGYVAEISAAGLHRLRPRLADETPDQTVHVLMPAAIDLQVNGSGGTMLNSDTSAQGIAHIVATQRRLGTGWVMPTLITCEPARIAAAAQAAIESRDLPGFYGLHLEGPHIALARKGTHRADYVRPLDEDTLRALARLRQADIPVMLTLAPEVVGPDAIARLTGMGVVVSCGHTEATAQQTQAALAAGARCFTHLFNAMPPMQSREPAVVGTAIGSHAFTGLIADGHHVSWEMLGIAWRARPVPGRVFLVSDAMTTIGGPDHFTLYGEQIHVKDGALVNAAGRLAGAHIDVLSCLRNVVTRVGVPLEQAIEAVCLTPANVMSRPAPSLTHGTPLEELVLLDAGLNPVAFA